MNRRLRALAFVFTALALAACASTGAPPPPAPMPPGSTWGAEPPPPLPPPPASRPTEENAAGADAAVGAGLRERLEAVVVEIGPADRRVGRQGGSAVVLLSAAPEDRPRNIALCQALFRSFDRATVAEVEAGSRVEGGVREELRPLYWLSRAATAGGADACAARVDRYDFARAERLRAKFDLDGRGPYLAVIADDDRRAGVVDVGASTPAEVADLVLYFKAGFSQEDDVWSPERSSPAAARARIAAFFSGRSPLFSALPQLVVIGASEAACPLGDLLDACGSRPRRGPL